jgi:hypothetical protein
MPPPPPNNVRGKLREVALRYGRAQRRRDDTINFIGRQRLRDLNRFFHHRYRSLTLPDDDSGREDLAVALDHIVWRSNGALVLRNWVRSWAPWISDSELVTMVNAAGRAWTATALGTHLGLTDDERTELKITTIAPRGLTEAEWKAIRKSRKRKRDRDAKRRKRNKAKADRAMVKASRLEDVQAVLPREWVSARDLSDLAAILPGLCDLPPSSRLRAVNRAINDLATAKVIETKRGPRNSRLIRDLSSND